MVLWYYNKPVGRGKVIGSWYKYKENIIQYDSGAGSITIEY